MKKRQTMANSVQTAVFSERKKCLILFGPRQPRSCQFYADMVGLLHILKLMRAFHQQPHPRIRKHHNNKSDDPHPDDLWSGPAANKPCVKVQAVKKPDNGGPEFLRR